MGRNACPSPSRLSDKGRKEDEKVWKPFLLISSVFSQLYSIKPTVPTLRSVIHLSSYQLISNHLDFFYLFLLGSSWNVDRAKETDLSLKCWSRYYLNSVPSHQDNLSHSLELVTVHFPGIAIHWLIISKLESVRSRNENSIYSFL